MTNLIYAEALEKELEYSIKLNFNSRKVRVYFQGTKVISDTEVYEFKSKSGCLFVTDQHIENIELAKPLKAKEKTGKVCTRCLGNKVYPKFAHVNGGRCFKCEGTGTI